VTTALINKICAYVQSSNQIEIPSDISDPSHYDMVIDIIDTLLDNADTSLNVHNGFSPSEVKGLIKSSLTLDRGRLFRDNSANIEKPQKLFKDEIDNSRNSPFRPKLSNKPHAIVPLDLLELPLDASKDEMCIGPNTFYDHPYNVEINEFYKTKRHSIFVDSSFVNPVMPPHQQPYEYVDTEENLLRMSEELEICTEIAVDLEHHSFRSFQGITCLMQV
jgi:exosome complex exonuclease RRP6